MRRFMPVVLLTFTTLATAAAHAGEPVAAPPADPAASQPAPVKPAAPAVRKAAPVRKKRWRPGAFWVGLGMNGTHVEESEEGCPGGQISAGLGGQAFIKLQRTSASFEESDTTGTCDGLFVGDSSIVDKAVMLGLAARDSGVFIAAGPSRVELREHGQVVGEDVEARIELGWSSRHRRGSTSPVGLEIALFSNNNELRHVHGLAVTATFGAAGR